MMVDPKEFEREWRRIDRQIFWRNMIPIMWFIITISFLFMLNFYSKTFELVMVLLQGAGVPLVMWMNKKDKKK